MESSRFLTSRGTQIGMFLKDNFGVTLKDICGWEDTGQKVQRLMGDQTGATTTELIHEDCTAGTLEL